MLYLRTGKLFNFFFSSDPERQYRFIFTAEPLHVRNRKLSSKFHFFCIPMN